jgi:hypothetical protein
MDDIRRHDRKLLIREILKPGRLLGVAAIGALIWLSRSTWLWELGWLQLLAGYSLLVAVWISTAQQEAKRKRFLNKHLEGLWDGCKDRVERLEKVLRSLRKEQIADLQELPKTVHRVAHELYVALRRADLISHEVYRSEGSVYAAPPVWPGGSSDPQAQELYRIADKNIAEYRQRFDAVMAGAQRAEAQAAVFMTALDTLRMQMISHRLTGKSPEMPSQEFLEAMAEARLQIEAVDKALDELDLSIFPRLVSIVGDAERDQVLLDGSQPDEQAGGMRSQDIHRN